MTIASLELPGMLGNPNLTAVTDPRLDPRLADFMAEQESSNDSDMAPDPEASLSMEEMVGLMEDPFEVMMNEFVKDLPPVTGVRRRSETIEGVDDDEIGLFIHEPEQRDQPLPGMIHTHGGGMAVMSTTNENFMRWRDQLAATGMVVIGVEFRNSAGKLGNHPFPAGLNDCASATQWAHRNREALGASGFIVSGDSGGGNLWLATALKANREGWIDQIAGVYATCPFIAASIQPPYEDGEGR